MVLVQKCHLLERDSAFQKQYRYLLDLITVTIGGGGFSGNGQRDQPDHTTVIHLGRFITASGGGGGGGGTFWCPENTGPGGVIHGGSGGGGGHNPGGTGMQVIQDCSR